METLVLPQKIPGRLVSGMQSHFIQKLWQSGALLSALAIICGFAAAQGTASLKAPSGLQILFLGTNGGPILDAERSESSTLLIVDGRPYLIDCGIGTIRRLLRANIESETIETIFFTHLHPDHALGLAAVMEDDFQSMGLNLNGSTDVIHIYGPPQTEEFVKAAFEYVRIPNAIFAAGRPGNPELVSPFKAHEIQSSGLIYHDDKIRVIAAENTHYALMPPALGAKMKSYSYRFETPYGAVVFTGDTGSSEAVTQLAKGADVLVSETSGATPDLLSAVVSRMAAQNHWSPQRTSGFMAHMTQEHLNLKQVGEMAAQAQVKSVVLYHSGPGDPSLYPPEVKKYFSGPVFAPADLDRYCLGGNANGEGSAGTLRPCR